jgi:hydrogenase maturation protein HypF
VNAVRVHITGVVQGVGFRPFVYRIATRHGVTGWVLNADDGVHVHGEGPEGALERFVRALGDEPPAAAQIASLFAEPAPSEGHATFVIRESARTAAPTTRVSPDLAVCDECLRELFDPANRRAGYPYINCTNCGPRFSIVLGLPYDRPRTTMRAWPLCEACRREYEAPSDRRFHAQPVACAQCGPAYVLFRPAETAPASQPAPSEGAGMLADPRPAQASLTQTAVARAAPAQAAVAQAATLLTEGGIVAVKGIGGYHLACDARNAQAVRALRERKFRKERPFALMARDLATARSLVELDAEAERLLTSVARPIVLARAKVELEGVAPENDDLGILLPYAPLHHLLFAAGAPPVLVLTSANRSSEPIAYLDEDAYASLAGIADAFLTGERPIARRIDDSVVRIGPHGPAVLRRARGLAPQAVASIPGAVPILALGADLKNAIVLVVNGQAFASQHVGDLDRFSAREAFEATVGDLCAMYEVDPAELVIAHDLHPGYHATQFAQALPARRHIAVQHHRAHIASVLAEGGAWETEVLGFAFDGTGYGDDGTIWGGEAFRGTLAGGLERVAHLRAALLPGGDGAARFPVQAAAGFLHALVDDGVLARAPFAFPERYARACELARKRIRTFETTSIGRLFDAVAALLGFTREQTFEGQAAMWLEHVARKARAVAPYPFPFSDGEFDYRPLLAAILADRLAGRPIEQIAFGFHAALAAAVVAASETFAAEAVVVSGGVFQNALLVELLAAALGKRLRLNLRVPPNDGGISLGQAALAAAELARK